MLKKFVKPFLISLLCLAIILGIIPNIARNENVTAKADTFFAKGADVGWLNQLENSGVKWVNDNGVQQDALQILKSKGINSIRLRVFVNPPSSFQWTKRDGTTCILGYGDSTGVVYMAQRAKALGMKIMIDFHYSDHFADPAYQDKPAAWVNHSFSQLQTDVYDHTYSVMSQLAAVGVYPEWVQVGNETNDGMLWPDGKSSNFSNWSKLINKGYDAVKKVSPSSKVVLHLANGYNNSLYRYVFDGLKKAGTNYDVIAMSYYPYWNNTDYSNNINDLSYNLNDMVSRYGKEVMVAEVGGLETNPNETYNIVRAVSDKVKAVPNNKGLGVFYWEPEANSSVLPDSYPLGSTTVVANKTLKFTTALDAFKDTVPAPTTSNTYQVINRNSWKSLNVSGGSASNGAGTEQYSYGDWNSQKWQLVSAGSGYYKIKNLNSGKILGLNSSQTQEGASVTQSSDINSTSHQWQLVDQGNGYYKVKNRNSGKLLSVKDSSNSDGATIILSSDASSYNQMWSFVKSN